MTDYIDREKALEALIEAEAINHAESAYQTYTNVSSEKMAFAIDWVM